jgi:hypothetical protein
MDSCLGNYTSMESSTKLEKMRSCETMVGSNPLSIQDVLWNNGSVIIRIERKNEEDDRKQKGPWGILNVVVSHMKKK